MTAMQQAAQILPVWADDGASDAASRTSAGLSSSLDVTLAALEAAAGAAGGSPEAAPELLRLFARGLDLAKTLRTICRAHLSVAPADTAAVRARSGVARREAALINAVKPVFAALDNLERSDPLFDAHPELRLWMKARRLRGSIAALLPPGEAAFAQDVSTAVLEPVRALHTHLTSTMALVVKDSDGHPRTQGFGASVAVLKNADDPVLRRTTYEAMNAWFASHSSGFLDVLNAHTGFNLLLLGRAGRKPLPFALETEGLTEEIYDALFRALEEKLPEIRRSVTLRQRAFGPGPMRVWDLLSPSPDALYERGRYFPDALADLKRAFEALDPAFTAFLERACSSGWIDAHGQSVKAGGTWCDDLPALGAVRICANYLPTLSGEAALAHLFGAAWRMQVLHDAPAPARAPMLAMTELAGNFCETVLARSLLARAAGTPVEKHLRWQSLKRLTNCLLTIPARHRLLRSILEERAGGLLSLSTVNALSTESWRHSFGDATAGEDRYVWAYKTHFYRPHPVFYDWQYVFGYLLSQVLADQFEKRGASAGGADLKTVWLESALLPPREFVRRHLGADLAAPDFWRAAVERALLPIRHIEGDPDYFAPGRSKGSGGPSGR